MTNCSNFYQFKFTPSFYSVLSILVIIKYGIICFVLFLDLIVNNNDDDYDICWFYTLLYNLKIDKNKFW